MQNYLITVLTDNGFGPSTRQYSVNAPDRITAAKLMMANVIRQDEDAVTSVTIDASNDTINTYSIRVAYDDGTFAYILSAESNPQEITCSETAAAVLNKIAEDSTYEENKIPELLAMLKEIPSVN